MEKKTFEEIMTFENTENAIKKCGHMSIFSDYHKSFQDSYKYYGMPFSDDGYTMHISNLSLAIFIWELLPGINKKEQDEFTSILKSGYKRGFADIKDEISNQLDIVGRTNENIQQIVCAKYTNMSNNYKNKTIYFAIISHFESIGYKEGQLYGLKKMMEAIDLTDNTEKINKNDFFDGLKEYVEGDYSAFSYIMRYKSPYQDNKLKWIGSKTEAIIFTDFLEISVAQFNKCFQLHDNKKLTESNRGNKTKEEYPIYAILKEYTPK